VVEDGEEGLWLDDYAERCGRGLGAHGRWAEWSREVKE